MFPTIRLWAPIYLAKNLPAFSKGLFIVCNQVIRVFEANIKPDHFMGAIACIEILR